MRGREYNPEKGDFAFFICPPNTITEQTNQVLKDNDIELFYFNSPIVEQVQRLREKEESKDIDVEEESPETIESVSTQEEEVIIVKEDKYKIEDIPGIGPVFAEKLRKSRIMTVKDLLNCNVKMKSKEIEGIGENRLNKWKQNARQILED